MECESDVGSSAIPAVESVDIDAVARELDVDKTVRERLRLPRSTLRRLGVLGLVYLVGVLVIIPLSTGESGAERLVVVPGVVLVALLFELFDSSAGMGFGTTLAPVLFITGYEPLQVIPVLLISESVTGFIAGGVHHEFRNVSFSFDPPNEATKLILLFGGVGALGSIVSIVVTYFIFSIPAVYIETYVALLVLLLGVLGILRAHLTKTVRYNRRRLVGFALLAGINKGFGGGGYGPVITVGQILSGVYEKSATAIASFAESFVSLTGVITFLVLASTGVGVDLILLPSVYLGGFLAAIVGPYLVRVVPNRVWSYLIPLYAITIGLLGLLIGLDV